MEDDAVLVTIALMFIAVVAGFVMLATSGHPVLATILLLVGASFKIETDSKEGEDEA